MNIETIIDPTTVQGTGNNLYALIKVDQDDAEDTTIQLWRADSEDHLYDQVLEELKGDEANVEELVFDFENELWGLLWLPQFIGTVK
jgi:hypothetical protein